MNRFRLRIMSILATMLIMACYVRNAEATPILLDQSYNPDPITTLAEVDEIIDHGQTFTVGLGGILSSIDVLICKGPNTTQDLLFDIRRTVAGVPVESDELGNNSVLARVRVPSNRIQTKTPLFINIDISSFNVSVSPGDVLAIVLRPSEPFAMGNDDGFGWGGTLDGNLYAGGTRYSRAASLGIPWESFPTRDMGFATYVAPVPEPATFLLLSTGLLGFGWLRRNRAGQ